MAKSTSLLRAIIGIGGAALAVVLSKKQNRDVLKQEIDKYKEDPESYKQNAREKVSHVSALATEEFNKVKADPKAFLNQKKDQFAQNSQVSHDGKREAAFDDEGGGDPSNNLRVVTEEDLKSNKNSGVNQ
ncbi:YtxH domain-containing protein [Staphylococcus hyicus]|uniref:YtxH domain-containing protein n=1 Tax=Staphylococcus hyicus TaxID=1284 RepID=UPI00211C6B2E|nr:YtxH domain-containing protein [Staphylococcus hyicus]MCQ9291073.1 YtxH domain-containing protein [Staphylococcus hyicus]MCQ9306314.1 YtxH domain-containing protein [Staphylococcus hyicus]MCQ9308727.1 YtxH domain-containing protein [Staphylococcus hyicus]MCQ9311148.1 YtxH domain-containing protein [Staphylococcus hyicus]